MPGGMLPAFVFRYDPVKKCIRSVIQPVTQTEIMGKSTLTAVGDLRVLFQIELVIEPWVWF